MSESAFISPPFDPTAYPTLTGAQLYQLVSGLTPTSDNGFTFTTVDSGANPDVPDGVTYPVLQRFIWRRVSATGVSAYMWSDNGTTDPTYQKWVSINVSAIGVGTIVGNMIADNTIPYNKIISLTWEQISNPPTFLESGDAAGGDLTGTYPNPSVATSAITTAKVADLNITNAKLEAASTTTGIDVATKIKPNGVGQTILRTNAGATAAEWAVKVITQLAEPTVAETVNYIRVNVGGTGYEFRTPAQTASDLAAALGPVVGTMKANCTFEGRGTNGAATLVGTPLNVASVTRSAAGVYTVAFTTPLAAATYGVVIGTEGDATQTFATSWNTKTVNGFVIFVAQAVGGTPSGSDTPDVSFIVF